MDKEQWRNLVEMMRYIVLTASKLQWLHTVML